MLAKLEPAAVTLHTLITTPRTILSSHILQIDNSYLLVYTNCGFIVSKMSAVNKTDGQDRSNWN